MRGSSPSTQSRRQTRGSPDAQLHQQDRVPKTARTIGPNVLLGRGTVVGRLQADLARQSRRRGKLLVLPRGGRVGIGMFGSPRDLVYWLVNQQDCVFEHLGNRGRARRRTVDTARRAGARIIHKNNILSRVSARRSHGATFQMFSRPARHSARDQAAAAPVGVAVRPLYGTRGSLRSPTRLDLGETSIGVPAHSQP
jgi:hypothetical protein